MITTVMARKAAAPRPIRRRSNGLRTRAEIVAAAERHFAEEGYEATRLDDVADDVGIRRAAIFYHFGDKHELYAAVLDEVFRDLTADLPAGGSAAERLEASLAGWIDFVVQRPNVARLILREAANARPGAPTPFVLAGKATGEWFRGLLEEGIASGEFRPRVEPDRFMGLIASIAFFHFAAMAWLTLESPVDPWSREELEKHKRELLLVAHSLLGIDGSANDGTDEPAGEAR
jgi:TetR/AcrR family transcriptional regulator